MPIVSMKDLLESGVHFGHRTQKWNPYMETYIFAARNDIHIIDLQQTVAALEEAYQVVRDHIAAGGSILFVGTKRQAQDIIKTNAEKVGMPYVIGRWLGGTLTNWQTIRERIQELERLEGMRDRGEFEIFSKKEALGMTRQIERLESRLGGIREMDGIPRPIIRSGCIQRRNSSSRSQSIENPGYCNGRYQLQSEKYRLRNPRKR